MSHYTLWRRDKQGGYARVRRWENRLIDKGLRSVSKAVGCFHGFGLPSMTIYRDAIVRDYKRGRRRPDPAFDRRNPTENY